MSEIRLKFKEKEPPMDFASSYTQIMEEIPEQEKWFTYPYDLRFCENDIKDYASYLVPENCQIYKIIKTNTDKETNNDDDYFEYEDGENVLVNHHDIHMEKPDMKNKKKE